MSDNDKSQKDVLFIFSLIAIIIIASFLVYEKMQEFGITQFLRETGYSLIEKVTAEDEKQKLASLYNQLLEKVEKKEISPDQVEYLASDIINLSNTSDKLSKEQVEKLFQETLEKINNKDAKKSVQKKADWDKLSKRLALIDDLKKNVSLVSPKDSADSKTYKFVFLVDESLNVVVDSDLQNSLHKSSAELHKKLAALEREKALKWRKQITDSVSIINQQIQVEMEALNEELKNMKFKIEIENNNLNKAKVIVSPDSIRKK